MMINSPGQRPIGVLDVCLLLSTLLCNEILTTTNYSKEVVIPPFILRWGRPGFKMSILGRSLGDPWATLRRSLGDPWATLGRSLGDPWAWSGWFDVGEPPVKKKTKTIKTLCFHTCRRPGTDPGGSKTGPCRRD